MQVSVLIRLFLLVFLFFLTPSMSQASSGGVSRHPSGKTADGTTVNLAGTVMDTHGEPIGDCRVSISDNDRLLAEGETGREGAYVLGLQLEKASLAEAVLTLEAQKASFRLEKRNLTGQDLIETNGQVNVIKNLTLERVQGPAFWIAAGVFALVYALIVFELVHRTISAMLGAAAMMLISYTIGTLDPAYRIFTFHRAMASIDMNVIILLMSMMIIVGILKHTGVFQWCAYLSFVLAKNRVFVLAVLLMAFTAFTSSFLDNVTTMLLLTGVAIEISLAIQLNPLYLLIPLVLASNVGGTATLIGDPPNIMIGSYARLTFLQFVAALAPVCILAMAALFLYTKIVWGRAYAKSQASVSNVTEFLSTLKQQYQITDARLLTQCLAVLGFVVFLFLSHGYWHMEVSIAALAGAGILFTLATATKKVDMLHLIEKDIEWPTLIFFMFLFMVVGAVEEVGLLSLVADWILKMSQGRLMLSMALILWVSAILSAFVDNIPFTATMLPIVAYLSKEMFPGGENTLWWALALGACLGGNGTIIGASANVVTMGIAESKGHRIRFAEFMKVAFPYMLVSVAICQAWLIIFRPA